MLSNSVINDGITMNKDQATSKLKCQENLFYTHQIGIRKIDNTKCMRNSRNFPALLVEERV